MDEEEKIAKTRAFKDEFTSTLDDAVKIQRRFQRKLSGTNYVVGIFGSSISKGQGHDVDVIISHAAGCRRSAIWVGEQLLVFSKKLIYWELMEQDDSYSDLFINFISNDNLYIDVLVRGLT